MNPILNIAIQAIRQAGKYILQKYELLNHNNIKSTNNIKIFTSEVHKQSNHIIITIIKKFYPSHSIQTHNDHINNKCFDYQNKHWIIDSIDNNDNFSKQFPFFALSIAVQYKENIEIGVVYDPIHNELFSACRGQGAHCNGYRIRINQNFFKNITTPILAISYSHSYQNIIIDTLKKIYTKNNIDFRRTGTTILDLVYVAIGRVDGCCIISLQKTNKLASAFLIVRESGGLFSDFNGNRINHHLFFGNIIVGNNNIIKSILNSTKHCL